MTNLASRLYHHEGVARTPLANSLVSIATATTQLSSRGYPYFPRPVWEKFRDTVPHILGMGHHTLCAVGVLEEALGDVQVNPEEKLHFSKACQVIRQVVYTASITAPPDLWLLRHVLGFLCELGLTKRLLEGEAIYPEHCFVETETGTVQLQSHELEIDLNFLLARGIVEHYDNSYRMAGHPRIREILEQIQPLAKGEAPHASKIWTRFFAQEILTDEETNALSILTTKVNTRVNLTQNHWAPTLSEINLGYRLVPVVLGLRATQRTFDLVPGFKLSPQWIHPSESSLNSGVCEILRGAGWIDENDHVTPLGGRGFARGPGPFGIIETYHAYMAQGAEILKEGRGNVWVSRGENVGASQDANRRTFMHANDALDRFCVDTNFTYSVFIEHAIGRGEATRQRFERSGEEELQYFGADLEDEAIDEAVNEQGKGRLPKNMVFVRQADIGDPQSLLKALSKKGVHSHGTVMMVGNGFHEVRSQTDEGMVAVFRKYHDAGVLLLFTEESALSVDDLRATAWNTYHAGFKYVHEKSGQSLRPAEPPQQPRIGTPLRASWSECAQKAGYVRATQYCRRSRTIYPYMPQSGFNPAISVNHFFVPEPIAHELGMDVDPS